MKFTRHAHHRKKRLSPSYRRPRGLQNKMRLAHKGTGAMVSVGFRSDVAARGKKQGLELIQVHSIADIDAIDAKTQAAVIGAVGMKKELALLTHIKEKKIKTFGIDPDKRIKELTKRFEERKQASATRRKEREEKVAKEKKEKKKEEKKEKKLEDAVNTEEKTEEEKQKDKVLTKAR